MKKQRGSFIGHSRARFPGRRFLPLALAALLAMGGLPPAPATAGPPRAPLASVAGGSADGVLGQLNFTSGSANRGTGVAANTLNQPVGMFYDSTGNRLFVGDSANSRVLAYDVASINNGEDAVLVLGQANFTSGSVNRGGSVPAANTLAFPRALAYNSSGSRLFVGDTDNNRVLVYDTTAITNGQSAMAVLGQASFITNTANRGGSVEAYTLYAPRSLAYDSSGSRLFVSDIYNNRVLVYDTATITDGENAVLVLGQPNFITNTANQGGVAPNTLSSPVELAYDSSGSRLFVADYDNHRVLVYDTTAITNGQSAVRVLGQPNFTTNTAATTQAGLNYPIALAYDSWGSRLFVGEWGNSRVLVYDTTTITNGQSAVAVLGQANFTSGSANPGGRSASTLSQQAGLAYDSSGSRLFVNDFGNHRALVFNAAGPTGTAVSIAGGATYANAINATLTLTATGAVQMQASDSASFTGASYQAYTTTLSYTLPSGADLSTHLTQGVEDVIRGVCMFAANIFPGPFWIVFKRLSAQSHLSRGSSCRGGFANG